MISKKKISTRQKRHWHIRKRVSGTSAIPRMAVFKSAKNIYVQFIDDESGRTISSASSVEKGTANGGNAEGAATIGKIAGEKALAAGITKVVFDRGGFKFHGRVKALADAARESGLQF